MATKTLKTRIMQKYDTFANWTDPSKQFTLLSGEIAVVAVPSGSTQTVNSLTAPQILFKVGDGVHKFNELPWASGLAADVYNWAKKENLDWNDLNETFKQKLQQYIEGQTNLSNYYTKSEADVISASVLTQAKDYTDFVSAANNTAWEAYTDAAISALNVTDTAAAHQVVTEVSETNGKISVKRAQLSVADIDGLQGALNSTLSDAKDYTDDAIESLTGSATIATNANGIVTLKAGISETNGVISNSSAADITLAKVATTGKAEDVAITSDLSVTYQTVQNAIDGIQTDLKSDEEIFQNAIADLQNALGSEATDRINSDTDLSGMIQQEITDRDAAILSSIQALSVSETTLATGETIKSIKEENGVVTVEKQAIEISSNAIADKIIDGSGVTADGLQVVTSKALSAYVKEQVKDLEGALHFRGVHESTSEVTDPKSGDVVVLTNGKEFIYDGSAWREIGDEGLYVQKSQTIAGIDQQDAITTSELQTALGNDVLSTRMATAEGNISTLSTDLAQEIADRTSADNEVREDLSGYVDSKINALDNEDEAETGKFVTAVSEADGIISVTRAALTSADIPTIPETKVEGLTSHLGCISTHLGCLDIDVGCLKSNVGWLDYDVGCLKSKVGCLDIDVGCLKSNVGCLGYDVGCLKSKVGCIQLTVGTGLVGCGTFGSGSFTISHAGCIGNGCVGEKNSNTAILQYAQWDNFGHIGCVTATTLKGIDTMTEGGCLAPGYEYLTGCGFIFLTKIARTGNVNDLYQASEDWLIFDCGSSTTVLNPYPTV